MFYATRLIDEYKHTNEGIVRTIWYHAHALLENENVQKYGVVVLFCPGAIRLGQSNTPLLKMMMESVQGALPVRIAAIHLCRPPTFLAIIWPIFKMFLTKKTLKRFKFHWGSNDKISKALGSYGIEKESLPAYLGGTHKHDHYAWLTKRRAAGK